MRNRALILCVFGVLFLSACGQSGPSSTVNNDPVPTSGYLTLTWDPVIDARLSGYRIHYGMTSSNYTDTINVGNYTSYRVTGLIPGLRYYFAVTAYQADGTESGFSNEAFKEAH